ncbi:hypothetical protein AAMO2058_000338800, partial [Amorphochlora amoebiformis]
HLRIHRPSLHRPRKHHLHHPPNPGTQPRVHLGTETRVFGTQPRVQLSQLQSGIQETRSGT